MKAFKVSGTETPAEQLATFAHYIQGEQFRFVVTRLPGVAAAVTHRASGKKVCDIPYMAMIASLNDGKLAGISALTQFIEKHGAARVRSVLSAAEK